MVDNKVVQNQRMTGKIAFSELKVKAATKNNGDQNLASKLR